MKIRHLLPILSLAAYMTPMHAEDSAPMLSYEGWVDAILQLENNSQVRDNPASAKDNASGSIRFTGAASLKTNLQITNSLSGRINMWYDPGSNDLNLREAYWNWGFADGFSWQFGKYIDHVGWISAEPTGPTYLFVNASYIGYTTTYGNDVLGTALNIAPMGSPITGSLHLTNGYYSTADGESVGYVSNPSANRENSDVGLGADIIYAVNEQLTINLEAVYDMHSTVDTYTKFTGGGLANTQLGGDVFMIGLNATYQPTSSLLIGAEIQYLDLGEVETAAGATLLLGIERLQGLLAINYKIPECPLSSSVTLMGQIINGDYSKATSDADEQLSQISLTYLTNPYKNLGINAEFALWHINNKIGFEAEPPNVNRDYSGWALSLEGIVSF